MRICYNILLQTRAVPVVLFPPLDVLGLISSIIQAIFFESRLFWTHSSLGLDNECRNCTVISSSLCHFILTQHASCTVSSS